MRGVQVSTNLHESFYDQKSRKDKKLSENTPRFQMYELKRCYVSKSRNQQAHLTNSSSIVFASAFRASAAVRCWPNLVALLSSPRVKHSMRLHICCTGSGLTLFPILKQSCSCPQPLASSDEPACGSIGHRSQRAVLMRCSPSCRWYSTHGTDTVRSVVGRYRQRLL